MTTIESAETKTEYHKIQTVYLRDPETNFKTLLDGAFATPEFAYLADCRWSFTEKVDGTNIRVIVEPDGNTRFAGKTDAAQMPPKLLARLTERFHGAPMRERLLTNFPYGAVLYGEGHGRGIQKGGERYSEVQDFVLFDVRVGRLWLQRETVQMVAASLDLPLVPIIGDGTLSDMVELARVGIVSNWGEFHAEGIVARPTVELTTRSGARIITKIKSKDFRK